MSLIHNRMGAVTLAVVAAVLLIGAGCQKQGYQPNSGRLDQGANTPSGATSDGSGALPIAWAEYRSEKLGITIPYPEGWVVEMRKDGQLVELYDRRPIPDSDMPARVQVQVSDQTVEQVRTTFPEITEESTISRVEQSVLRIVHPRDIEPAADETLRLSYLWAMGSRALVVEGAPDDSIFEEIVDRLLRKAGQP